MAVTDDGRVVRDQRKQTLDDAINRGNTSHPRSGNETDNYSSEYSSSTTSSSGGGFFKFILFIVCPILLVTMCTSMQGRNTSPVYQQQSSEATAKSYASMHKGKKKRKARKAHKKEKAPVAVETHQESQQPEEASTPQTSDNTAAPQTYQVAPERYQPPPQMYQPPPQTYETRQYQPSPGEIAARRTQMMIQQGFLSGTGPWHNRR